MMRLNSLTSSDGTRSSGKRVGRGPGSGKGKTSGRGHKGQHSRSGGYHKVGFEGGQMPLARRLPKRGFSSRIGSRSCEVRLSEINLMKGDKINPQTLKDSGLVSRHAENIKIILSGKIEKKVSFQGVKLTKGARLAVEAAGGIMEE